jgi:uncharacterized protein YeaO (DUF488 family)
MASNVATVGAELVAIINAATLPQTVTAVYTYEPTKELPALSTVSVDVWPSGRNRTRFDRDTWLIQQAYSVSVRKRCSGGELSGDDVSTATMNTWSEFVESLEKLQWKGNFSTLYATLEGVEILAPYDLNYLREFSTFAAALTFNVKWYEQIT